MAGRAAALALAALGPLPAGASAPPLHVPVERRAELQALLDRHRAIRLDPAADYGTGPPLRLSAGTRIEAGWNTVGPPLVIAAGARDVRVVGLQGRGSGAPDVVFEGGAPTEDVTIVGGNGGSGRRLAVQLAPGSRVARLRLTDFGALRVDHADAGYVRDSRFTRLLAHSPGPVVDWHGNAAERSTGNAFLGLAAVTPGRGARWREAGDLWLVSFDCESWNGDDRGWRDCFTLERMRSVVGAGPSGGTAHRSTAAALARLDRVDAALLWFVRGTGGSAAAADVVLHDVGTALIVQPATSTAIGRTGRGGPLLELLAPLEAPVRRPWTAGPAVAAALRAVDASPPPPVGPKPVLRPAAAVPIGDGGDDVDSAAVLQALIDAHGVARVPPGVHRLRRPLRIGSTTRIEGLIGAGPQATVLVAGGDFPLVAGRGDLGRPGRDRLGVQSVVVAGLAFRGGSHAIRWSAEPGDTGPGGTIAWSTFADLDASGQRVAAFAADGIYGLDSNTWRNVDVRATPTAWRGRGRGADLGMSYADKQLFLDVQVRDVPGAVWDWSADRASGGHVWQDAYFHGIGQLSRTRAANNLLWVNSVFEDVAGPVAIDVLDDGSTATYHFHQVDCAWRGRGPAVVTDTQSWHAGTLFVQTEFAQRGGRLVADAPGQSLHAWRSRITGTVLAGRIADGVLVDSDFGPGRGRWRVVDRGRVSSLADEPPDAAAVERAVPRTAAAPAQSVASAARSASASRRP